MIDRLRTRGTHAVPVFLKGLKLLAASCAVMAVFAVPAFAHQGDPNYRSNVDPMPPALEGVEVSVLNFDDSLKLVNRSGKTIVIEGYDGEPYVRLNADGTVEVNVNSPAYFLNDDRYANVDLPDNADSNAEPEWQEVDGTGQYAWHDHRAHWMGEGLPPQVTDENQVTKVFDYAIPVEVDGEKTEITGTLTWVGSDDGGFPVAAIVGLVVIVAAGVVVMLIARRRRGDDDEDDTDEKPGSDDVKEAW